MPAKREIDEQGLCYLSRGWAVWVQEPKRRSCYSIPIHEDATIQLCFLFYEKHKTPIVYIEVTDEKLCLRIRILAVTRNIQVNSPVIKDMRLFVKLLNS